MNERDLVILKHLRQNARIRLTELSRKTGIPVSTVYDRIKQLEKKVIIKHAALVDFSKMGFSVRVMIFLKASEATKEQLSCFLEKHTNVNNLYWVNNDYDFLAEGVFKEMGELEVFLKAIDECKPESKVVHHVLEDKRSECFFANP